MRGLRNNAELRPLARRWLKFNAVGAIGFGVQLAALSIYISGFGWHYLVATGLAVETAVLHNFVWHERWTWRERTRHQPARRQLLNRLFRFHVSNGVVSILSNLVLMRLFVGGLGLHYLPANVLSIVTTAVANFLLSELFVFRGKPPA